MKADAAAGDAPRQGLRAFLLRDWPYLAMFALAVLGVAYTTIARRGMTGYWVALAPIFGAICVAEGWRQAQSRKERLELLRGQALHWFAVLCTMYLVLVASMNQLMNSSASALMVLAILALGTFTAGVHTASWRITFVGAALALAVPAIAWIEEATLLLVLIGVVAVAFVAGPLLRFPSSKSGDKAEGHPA